MGTFRLDNPFVRWSKEIDDYPGLPDEHDYVFNSPLVRENERSRIFKAKKGTTEGSWYANPRTDSDESF
jgi:hypothetical protein